MAIAASSTGSPPGAPAAETARWWRRVAFAAAAIALLILVAWLATPPIARSQIEKRLGAALGRPVSVGQVEFAPFALRFTVRDLSVSGAASTVPLLAVDEVVADVSSASIWHRAPVLDALRVTRPRLAFTRKADGTYDVDDVMARLSAPSDKPRSEFSLNNIEIVDGAIAFDDGATQRNQRIEALQVGIPFLSTIPYQTDIHVTPKVEGTVNGARFAVAGNARPFAQEREATLEINFDDVALPQYIAYVPAKLRYDLAHATATTRLVLAFIDGAPERRRLELRGEARVDGIAIKRRDGRPLAGVDRVQVKLDRVDLLGHEARIAQVTIDGPAVDVIRGADGMLELAQPVVEGAPARDATPSIPWTVRIASLAVRGGSATVIDEATSFRSDLADITIDASGLSNVKGEKTKLAASFVSADRVATFKGDAEADLMEPAATGHLAVGKFSLGQLFPYYRDALAVDVQKGALDFEGSFAYASGRLTLADGTATLADLALAYPGKGTPFLHFPVVAARGIVADVPGRKIGVATIEMRSPVMQVARERDGSIDVSRILRTSPGAQAAPDTAAWLFTVGRVAVQRASVDAEDRMQQPVVKLVARDLDITARDFANTRDARVTLTARSRLGEKGRLAYDGTLVPTPFALAGTVDVSGINLVSVRPYVESQVNVSITAGTLAAKGRVNVATAEPARVSWKGNVDVADFVALDKHTASDLTRWKRLSLTNVDVGTAPFRLAIDSISARDYYARLIVYQDGTLNLTRLLTPGAAPEPATDAQPKPVADATTSSPRAPLPVTLGRIELADGNVNFSDFFVRPNYSANLTEVSGSISTMSRDQAGDVAITARVDHSASVEVKGRLSPFSAELALDLAGTARDVDLPPMSTYAIKYAGYGIEKGKLSFDVHYRIEGRRLVAENRLVLDQLTFNPQRVDSPTATRLPVLLAVALLKNAQGVIDLRLPIAGSLDDPQFSVGGLIVQVIVNLITKAVTAPFALLSSAFGKGEELSVIPFAAGVSTPGDDARARLDTLGKALAERPALKLDVAGRADPVADRDALRQRAVDDALKREKMKSLAADGKAPPSLDGVTMGPDERVRWLTAAYRESSIADRPRNAVGMLESVPAEKMETMLRDHAKVDDEALKQLANARATAVKDALMAKAVAGERIFVTAARLGNDTASRAPANTAATASPAPAASMSPAADAPASRVDLALR